MSLRNKVINKENKFYAFMNHMYYFISGFRLPLPKRVYSVIYYIVTIVSNLFWALAKVFWLEPLFMSQCEKYGKNITMSRFLPYILGKGKIYIGNNCRINGKLNVYFSNRYFDNPCLRIGDNCSLGHILNINVADKIHIGDHVRIGSYVVISDSDGHPKTKLKRRDEPVSKDSIMPVIIENDVWIGRNCIILKGIRIGEGAIVGAGSIVTKDVQADTIVAGNPARFISSVNDNQ